MRDCNVVIVYFILTSLSAQIGGTKTYQFLELSPSPRHMALGTWISTLSSSSISSSLANPAQVSDTITGQFIFNYQPYFAGINSGTAAFSLKIKENHLLLIDARFLHYGSFDERDNLGDKLGTFTGNEVAFGVSYSHHFTANNLSLGARVNIISSTLEQYNSIGLTGDFGVYYDPENSQYRFGLVARNVGSQLTTYDTVKEPIPFTLSFGLSNALEYLPFRWHLTLDHLERWDLAYANPNQQQNSLDGDESIEKPSFLNEFMKHIVFSAELFPERPFSLQLGYNFLRSTELKTPEIRSFSGLSFGFGINLRKFRFNYSHARYSIAGNTNFIGLTFTP